MKLIIDIPEEEWLFIKAKIATEDDSYIDRVVANGTPIPDNATVCDIEQITADIYEHFMTIDGGVHDKSALKCMEIIDKYKASEEISERNMKMWEEIFKAERSGK